MQLQYSVPCCISCSGGFHIKKALPADARDRHEGNRTGYRSEEDDPAGTQHILYYNPRGKAQFDIQDYSGLNLVSKFLYDGLDRLASTTLPEGGNTAYSYATAPNPWANNVASIVRPPKP